jgi:hypothetical protein
VKVKYRGFEIDVRREKSMGGDVNVYFSVYGLTSGLPCLADSFENSADLVRDYVKWMKARVDEYHANPAMYEEVGCE